MATRMGSPGVRIELHDKSGYSLVETPNAVAGVVGFAPKGELNKIQKLTNTAEQDMYFGLGFNNSRYNQGMYAARAVINAGGHVEFVRPYGEEIDKTDDFKRDLKTDAYVVAFDRDAIENKENAEHTSLKMEYFASTRYKVDGAARYGATRKINNIAETIVKNSNVDFSLDAAEDFTKEENWETNKGVARGNTDTVLFSIMNADPSGANRAYSTFAVSSADDTKRAEGVLVVTCASKVGFAVGDTVYGPMGALKVLGKFEVTNIVDKKVTLEASDEATRTAVGSRGIPEVLIYSEGADAVNTGSDYLTVKTAVAGSGAKTFSAIQLDDTGLAMLKGTDATNKVYSGTPIEFANSEGEPVYVRIANPVKMTGVTLTKADDVVTATLTDKQIASLFVGDVIQAEYDTTTNELTVLSITDGVVTFSPKNTIAGNLADVTLTSIRQNWADSLNTLALSVTEDSTVKSVAEDIVALVGSEEIGFGIAPTIGDIMEVSDTDRTVLTLAPGAAIEFVSGDLVAVTRSSVAIGSETSYTTYSATTDAEFGKTPIAMFTTVKSSDPITNTVVLNDAVPADEDADIGKQLLNLTQTTRTAFAAKDSYTYDSPAVSISDISKTLAEGSDWTTVGTNIYTADIVVTGTTSDAAVAGCMKLTFTTVKPNADVSDVETDTRTVDCVVTESSGTYTVTFKVPGAYVKTENTPVATDVIITDIQAFSPVTKEYADIYFVGNFTVSVPRATQDSTTIVKLDNIVAGEKGTATVPFQYTPAIATESSAVVERSEKVLTDTAIGTTFVGLGLANIRYMDVNFTGSTVKVYDLTDEGEAVARLYLSVAYMYNGVRYEFDGTIIKYVYNNLQLYIGDTAERELVGSGVQFVLNDSGELDMFLEDNSYDLSGTVVGGKPSSTMTCVSFNENDPAIINNAVWTYDPKNNMNTSTLSNAFNLFIDKDKSDVTFFVGAGLGINNFGMRKYETLNTQLMQAVLSICELRKDCFALFDGVAEPRIEQALKLDSPASRFGSTLGRWGAIYDARPIFADRVVTMSNVEAAPSIAMASLITANRRGAIWWHVPAGEDTGMIPGAWCTKVKYERTFNIPEDPDSDIARLCDIHVNPFRTNKKGIYAFGDFTMQMEDTAFNAINVTMLVAGIHKMYYDYLDSKVFRLNTAALRAQITTDLQEKLDEITSSNPAGLEYGVVTCDDTNNTPEVIEAHKLYVDLDLIPTDSTRYITLRTNVLSRANGKTISTEISTRAR